jgi:hypothetical protein
MNPITTIMNPHRIKAKKDEIKNHPAKKVSQVLIITWSTTKPGTKKP